MSIGLRREEDEKTKGKDKGKLRDVKTLLCKVQGNDVSAQDA